tara:strand:+ start:105 stop:644 length:540 start_codon:yes stop_codon:yes gene_type:complete
MDLSRKMTRAELKDLSDVERKERNRLQKRKHYQENRDKILAKTKKYNEERKEEITLYNKKYYQENREITNEKSKKYYEEHREEIRETKAAYFQSPIGKKSYTLSNWKQLGLQESPEDLDRIYELRETQELCNACDVKLTRTGKYISTDTTMDHDHITHRFRHIICRGCNTHDNWMKYFC